MHIEVVLPDGARSMSSRVPVAPIGGVGAATSSATSSGTTTRPPALPGQSNLTRGFEIEW